MTYQTTGAIDFEEIIVGTRTLDDPGIKRSRYIGTYAALEMQVRDDGLAQSLPEYLATQYWLMNLSADKIADKFADIISFDPNFIRGMMMTEFNILKKRSFLESRRSEASPKIPRRKGNKGSRKAVR
ncbi:MAG: hypothetical protein HYU56_02320 [Candidatus Aenigmarchaeota archaeon]|nr:hypothetical protein [Candidatus Aenigmarchaeota archaeon]